MVVPTRQRPVIGLTMGDANGIGPELLLRAFTDHALPDELVVIGDYAVLEFACGLLRLKVALRAIARIQDVDRSCLNVLDQNALTPDEMTVGKISGRAGEAARSYIVRATQLALAGELDAIVTLPVNKEAVRLSDLQFSGHTELLATLCEQDDYCMLLVSDKLAVSHVSTHVPLLTAIRRVTPDRVASVIRLTHAAIGRIRSGQRLAVAGLNPHAGEHGAFGTEEDELIRPAIFECRGQGIDVVGPCPPDSVFLQASRGRYDAVVAMYHDQGHIPLKLLDFEAGVNVTLGLPLVRTSVDHGTAYDIAYRGIGSTQSLVAACRLAVKLASGGSLV